MQTGPYPVIVTFVLLLGAGCSATDSDGDWAGTVEKLPNGAERVVNPAQGVWETGQPWQLVPEFVIGEIEGTDAKVFSAVSGLEVDATGRIYVLDRQANELRIFAPDGAHVRTVGRTGAGPGEYANANGLEWIAADTLLVVDQRGERYTVLNAEGDFVRSVPRRLQYYGWVFSGGREGGRIYETTSVGPPDDRRPALLGTQVQGAGLTSDTARIDDGVAATLTSAHDTVMLPKPNAPLYESFVVRTTRAMMSMSVPFTARPVYHLDGSGGIWHGRGSDARIFRSSFAGDTTSEIVMDAVPTPVTPEELAEWEAGESIKRFKDMGGKMDMSRIPKIKPFFDDIYADSDGYLWLSVPASPAETVFAVLDPKGRYLGRLQLPGISRDAFLPLVVRNGRLYFVGRDELDVQRVYAFRIER